MLRILSGAIPSTWALAFLALTGADFCFFVSGVHRWVLAHSWVQNEAPTRGGQRSLDKVSLKLKASAAQKCHHILYCMTILRHVEL